MLTMLPTELLNKSERTSGASGRVGIARLSDWLPSYHDLVESMVSVLGWN